MRAKRSFVKDYWSNGRKVLRVIHDGRDVTYGAYRSYEDGGGLVAIVTKETPKRWIVTGYPDRPHRTLNDAVKSIIDGIW